MGHSHAHHSLNIAVIETQGTQNPQAKIFKDEIKALLEGDRNVNFISYPVKNNEGPEFAQTLLNTALSNKKVDMVLVLDVSANQSLGLNPSFSKPTFLPYIFNARLSGLPLSGNSSGKKNLNYITFDFDFEKELKALQAVAPFSNVVLISNPRTQASIKPEMIQSAKAQAKKAGVDLTIKTFSSDVSEISLPANTDAVLYGFFPGANQVQTKALISAVNARGITSFSLIGEEYVRLGALATNVPTADWEKLARRTALHMEEVLLGTPASNLPVFFESSSRLMINMETSRQIRIAPSFDILSEATLINELAQNIDRNYSLTDVARQAVNQNLSLAAQRLQAESANQSVNEVRSGLLPQINSSINYTTRKDDTAAIRAGTLAENSTDGSISLVQPLFVEERWAAFTIEKFSALSQQELLREVELDITQAAVNSYLNVLLEKTALEQERYNLDITRENYRLAQNRVEVGTQTAADLFRWESELANAKQAVLQAKSSFEQQRQQLNQILNRPIDEEFNTTIETLENPDLLISDKRITTLIKNTYDLEALTDFFVDIGLDRAPELKQTHASINASKRQLESDQRAYWLPELNLTSELTSNFDEDRAAGGIQAEDNDWRVGLELSLPLYEGGARSARSAQSRLAIKQFEINLKDLKNQIEQDIRNNLEAAHASYNSIPLAKQAETAAQKNYDLINDSYAQGAKNITDVLDAQDTLIAAREGSMNAVYAFLIDLMNVQRAIGAYDFFLTDTQRIQFSDELIQRVANTNERGAENDE
ncbi:MAG: TolC family protein [Pseudomonadota bacterium]